MTKNNHHIVTYISDSPYEYMCMCECVYLLYAFYKNRVLLQYNFIIWFFHLLFLHFITVLRPSVSSLYLYPTPCHLPPSLPLSFPWTLDLSLRLYTVDAIAKTTLDFAIYTQEIDVMASVPEELKSHWEEREMLHLSGDQWQSNVQTGIL